MFNSSSLFPMFILFPLTGKKPLAFRETLSLELAQEYIAQRHHQMQLRSNSRIIIGLHEIASRTQRNCCICSTMEHRRTTIYYCVQCDKNVCPIRCFYTLHTKMKVNQRNKTRNLD